MPHCIIEFSQRLQPQLSADTLIEAVHQAVQDSGLFDVSHIRSRAQAYRHARTGNDGMDFIHVTVRLHRGRSTEQKRMLTGRVLASLSALGLSGVALSVEAVEMDTESYARLRV